MRGLGDFDGEGVCGSDFLLEFEKDLFFLVQVHGLDEVLRGELFPEFIFVGMIFVFFELCFFIELGLD